MHVVLGILGSLITILILVNRLSDTGLDMGKLNPFAWARRKKWQEKYYADPAFSLDSPMEAAAGLMYVMAKCSGEISREQKQCILHLFQKEFKLNDRRATELLSSCSFLLKDEDKIVE
ncbi:MAG: TerB family tellurite resistance protein, partial [Nitrospinaceae bacterium]|nr:TerB family tellurite resistance protein [Nitrospinaceae bacterium]NIR57798.1 TerB family tellurite resistance protein [Nitrospinaceae bacterium]NIS88257.1 TerB family tellurite resistance protein [Nitrospinaceae bacterium]NIT85138.1 TerB family tellurite resistance protein [Nitrospinaceae bacterium]NIU47294.1 TerB family tellurite resistance protein [Nitrospinaceae bacterium]